MSANPNEERKANLEDPATPPAASEGPSPAEDLAPAQAPPPASLEETVQKLLAEKQQFFDQLLRKQAELENFRKRTDREKEEFLQYTLFNAVKSLLPILDGFELALGNDGGGEDFRKGVELIYKQLLDALQKLGLEIMEAKGHEFDPYRHEAVITVATDEYPDQEIVEELQRGYFFKQRLLRPAMVKVAKRPAVGSAEKKTDG